MAAWRLARSLEDCRAQADAFAPHRSKASDGTIGDASHAAGPSGHNPNAAGVVTAFDLTQDAAGGMDAHRWIRALIASGQIPEDLHYAISDRQICNRDIGPWTWRPYKGADPHTNHVHLSVGRGPDSAPVGPYDDASDWCFAQLLSGASAVPVPQEDDMYIAAIHGGPDDGKEFLVHGDVRQYVGDPAVVKVFTDAGVPMRSLTGPAWALVVNATALDIEGLRTLPRDPNGQGTTLQQIHDAVVKG